MKTKTAAKVMCSWCHTLVVANSPAYCPRCSHRADVPRIFCDCTNCRVLHARHVALALTPEDREQLTGWTVQRLEQEIRQAGTGVLLKGALQVGLDFEQWRRYFVRNASAEVQRHLCGLDALGVDLEVVLRRCYAAATRTAVN